MKKYLLIAAAALAATALVSCNKDPEGTGEKTDYDGPVTLCINELNGVKGYKSIELYNYGDKAIDLKDWVLMKNLQTDPYWTGTVGTIAPGGFFVVYANKDYTKLVENVPDGHAGNGGLSNKKRLKIVLKDPNGNAVDTFTRFWDDKIDPDAADTPDLTTAVAGSYARATDHGNTWKVLAQTIGATNAGAEVISETIPTE